MADIIVLAEVRSERDIANRVVINQIARRADVTDQWQDALPSMLELLAAWLELNAAMMRMRRSMQRVRS